MDICNNPTESSLNGRPESIENENIFSRLDNSFRSDGLTPPSDIELPDFPNVNVLNQIEMKFEMQTG